MPSQNSPADREKVAAFITACGLATGHGDTIDDLLSEAKGQITRLAERCEGYKGQVEYGASEIARLTRELDAAGIKVRWEDNKAFVGAIEMGEIVYRKINDQWDVYINHIPCGVLHESDKPSARAAVEKAAIEALTREEK